jgi:hypothetical protein
VIELNDLERRRAADLDRRMWDAGLDPNRGDYYDVDGESISIGVWAMLLEKKGAWQGPGTFGWVDQTPVGDMVVSTIWLGLDHNFHWPPVEKPAAIFETMIFQLTGMMFDIDYGGLAEWRYPSKEAARAGHDHAVQLAERAGIAARLPKVWEDWDD